MPKLRLLYAAAVAATLLVPPHPSRAVEATDTGAGASVVPQAWPTSPFHGVISGATGEPIPCRCRFRGGAYRLGAEVCMSTPLGVQLARCDLVLNNTSWIPTGVSCTMSRLRTRLGSPSPHSSVGRGPG